MGKVEDMRKQREQRHAQAQREAEGRAAAAPPVEPAVEPAEAPVVAPRGRAPRREAASEEGKCPVCGKVKALQNGLIASHQKGLGKMCPGSRKDPA